MNQNYLKYLKYKQKYTDFKKTMNGGNWWEYDKEIAVDLKNLVVGKKYFLIEGTKGYTGEVTVLSNELKYGINIEWDNTKIQLVFEEKDFKKIKFYELIKPP